MCVVRRHRKKAMNSNFMLPILYLAGMLLGFSIGNVVTRAEGKHDCEIVGFHRAGDDVYECRKVTK